MSSYASLHLGEVGIEIELPKYGRTFNERDMEIILEARTASGKLVQDRTAVKKFFEIIYDGIKSDDLDDIIDLYELGKNLNFIITERDTSFRDYTVKLRPFARSRWLVTEDWMYRNVMFELEEI